MNRFGPLLGALVWLAIIVVIALGAAGLVTGMDHPPGSAGRPELTAPGDAEVTPLLDAAEADLTALSDRVEALGTRARAALGELNGGDATAVQAAIAEGDDLVVDVIRRTIALRSALAGVPYVGTPEAALVVSPGTVARHAALVAALDATDGLDAAWAGLTTGSVAATRMSELLAKHDALVAQAAEQGRLAKYTEALKLLEDASAQLKAARDLRNQLVRTVDVAVLDEWLKRNGDYDTALGNLYKAISKVGRTVTPATRAAVKAEADARARLPRDTRGLVVIMAEIGRGRMNGAIIAIEEARAELTAALEAGAAASETPGADGGS